MPFVPGVQAFGDLRLQAGLLVEADLDVGQQHPLGDRPRVVLGIGRQYLRFGVGDHLAERRDLVVVDPRSPGDRTRDGLHDAGQAGVFPGGVDEGGA